MKKIKEVFSSNFGFFTSLYDNAESDYTELFDGFDTDTLDMQFVSEYGERYIAPLVINCEVDTGFEDNLWMLARITYQLNVAKWLRVKQALDAEYNVAKPYDVTITTNRERDFTSDSTTNTTDTNTVYGFNDSINGTPNDKDVRNSVRDIDNQETTTGTQRKVGSTGTRNIANLILTELNLRNTKFIQIVMNDLAELYTLDIYDD